MSIIKYDPFRGFDGLVRRMNHFMNVLDKPADFSFERSGFTPRVDISEDDKHIFVNAEIPGLGKDDIKVSINNDNVLMIQGEKRTEEKEENKNYLRIERNFGSFTRSFILPENVKTDAIQANYKNGLLRLEIEKTEPEKPKEISVQIN